MQTFTYEGIREKALKQGITDNRLRVGLWAFMHQWRWRLLLALSGR